MDNTEDLKEITKQYEYLMNQIDSKMVLTEKKLRDQKIENICEVIIGDFCDDALSLVWTNQWNSCGYETETWALCISDSVKTKYWKYWPLDVRIMAAMRIDAFIDEVCYTMREMEEKAKEITG